MIAGEALTGLVTATFRFLKWKKVPDVVFENPSYTAGIVVAAGFWGDVLVKVPLANAGRPARTRPATRTAIV